MAESIVTHYRRNAAGELVFVDYEKVEVPPRRKFHVDRDELARRDDDDARENAYWSRRFDDLVDDACDNCND